MSAVLEGICVCALYCATWFLQDCTVWKFSDGEKDSVQQEQSISEVSQEVEESKR